MKHPVDEMAEVYAEMLVKTSELLLRKKSHPGWIKRVYRCQYCGVTMGEKMVPSGKYLKYKACGCMLS